MVHRQVVQNQKHLLARVLAQRRQERDQLVAVTIIQRAFARWVTVAIVGSSLTNPGPEASLS